MPGGFGNGLDEFSARSFEAYEPDSDTWHKLEDLPDGRHHLMAAALDGLIYIFGGSCIPACINGSDTVWAYDPGDDSWRAVTPMPERRTAGSAVSLDGFLYVVGGTGDTGDLLRYDPAVDTWSRMAPMMERREHIAAVAANGEIYVLGGRWREELNSVEIYNPELDEWRAGPPMLTPRGGHAAAFLDGKIYVLGGEVIVSSPTFELIDSVEVYDLSTSQWSSHSPLPEGLHGVPAAVYQGVLYTLGGSARAGDVANQGRVYAWKP